MKNLRIGMTMACAFVASSLTLMGAVSIVVSGTPEFRKPPTIASRHDGNCGT